MKILISLSAALVGAFSYYSFKIFLLRRKYRHLPGPSSKGLIGFYFGQYFRIVKHISAKKILQDLHFEWFKAYGPVYAYQVLNTMVVIVNDESAVKTALIEEDLPKKGIGAFPLGERFLGIGLLTEIDKKKWRNRRAMMNNGFKKDILMQSLDEFNSKGDLLLQRLNNLSKSNECISLFNEINHMTLDVIAKVAFDLDTDSLNNPESKLNNYICRGLEAVTLDLTDPLCFLKPSKRKHINSLKQSIRNLRHFSIESLQIKLKELQENNFMAHNILSLMIKNFKTDDDFDFDKLVDDFITFFVGGQETTANALSFCFLELGQNPQVLKKLKEEIDLVLGKKSTIDQDDLARLEYTSAVFNESMRKWPPVPSFSRLSAQECEILGYKIPKNSWFIMPVYIMGRNENYFSRPKEFIPERFLKNHPFSKENKINSYTFFPFSLGPRNCIGQNFAKIEGKLILAKLIQHFDFKLDPDQSFDVVQYTTLRPIDGVKVFLTPRF
uniref:Cytochrome p450 3049E1 n=1 Tax=Brachionus koreanus TaxID=1199090 RepID=W8RYU8_9BILA|nr:cytochrome p450 3049E1 [Brachionus koreanus]